MMQKGSERMSEFCGGLQKVKQRVQLQSALAKDEGMRQSWTWGVNGSESF